MILQRIPNRLPGPLFQEKTGWQIRTFGQFFRIEKGKIVHPVTNFRWNDSPIAVLKNIDAMSEAVRTVGRSWPAAVAPALRVKSFELSSVSDAV